MPRDAEKLKVDVEIPKEIKGETRDALENLKSDIENNLGKNLRQLVIYCQNEDISFRSWKQDGLDQKGFKEMKEAFSKAGLDTAAIDILEKGNPGEKAYDTAQSFVEGIVGYMDTAAEEMSEFQEAAGELNEGMAGDFLSDATTMLKKGFAKHPWQMLLAGGILVATAYHLGNTEPYGKYIKGAAVVGAVGWALNLLSGDCSKDGRTWVQQGIDAIHKEDDPDAALDSFLDRFKDNDNIDVALLRQSFELGSIDFSVFLEEFADSYENGKDKISMKSLRRKARTAGIDSDAFDERNGEGLYALMESITAQKGGGDPSKGIDRLRGKYGEGGQWEGFSFLEVMNAEFSDEEGVLPKKEREEIREEVDDARARRSAKRAAGGATVAGGAAAASGSREEASSDVEEAPESDYDELLKVSTLEDADVELRTDGTASLWGFEFNYKRAEYAGGSVRYEFKELTGPSWSAGTAPQTFSFEVGAPFDESVQNSYADSVKSYLERKLKQGLTEPELRRNLSWDGRQWNSKYNFKLDPSLGRSQKAEVAVTIDPGEQDKLTIQFRGETFEDLEEGLSKVFVVEGLRAQEPALRSLEIRVHSIDAAASTPRKIHATAEGSPLEFHWDASKNLYEIDQFTLSSSFIESERRAVENDPEIDKIFEDILDAGEKLSNWRVLLDLLSIRFDNVDSKNHVWEALTTYKKEQISDRYARALEQINREGGSPADKLRKVSEAKNRIVESVKRPDGLASLPARMAQASETQQSQLGQEFADHGYSAAYRDRYHTYSAAIEGYDYSGSQERSGSQYAPIRFKLEREFYRHTKLFEENAALTPAQQDYCNYVQGEILRIIVSLLKKDSTWWEKWGDSMASTAEFHAVQKEFDGIREFNEWSGWTGRSEIAEITNPELNAYVNNYRIEHLEGGKVRIHIGEASGHPTIWEGKLSGGNLEITSMEMTPDMMEAQVERVGAMPEFNRPFDNLASVFEGVELGWWGGSVEEGKWRSLVEYKRSEVLDDYRQDLRAIMGSSKSPTDKAKEWRELDKNFGNRYLGALVAYRDAMVTAIGGMSDPETEITKNRFDEFYRGAERLGYENGVYAAQMQAFRHGLVKYNFAGLEDWDSKNAYDVMNKASLLMHRLTGSMGDLPKAQWTNYHSEYFKYVEEEVFHAMRAAEANNKGTGTWLQEAIGRDEIPPELHLMTFEDFRSKMQADPAFRQSPRFGFDPEKARKEAEAKGPIVNPDGTEVVDHRARLQEVMQLVQGVYEQNFLDKIKDDPDAVDPGDATAAKPYLERFGEVTVRKIYQDGVHQDQYLKEYADVVEEVYTDCEDSFWKIWTWGDFDPDVVPEA